MSRSILPDMADNCVHHWILDSPKGGFCDSRCKKCGAEKQHRNGPSWLYQEAQPFGGAISVRREPTGIAVSEV